MTIRDTVEFYKKNYTRYWAGEKDKWKAVKHFQDHWDIDAEDFAGMVEESLRPADFLLTGYNYFPQGMLLAFCRRDPEKMRSLFTILFDENLKLDKRIKTFRDGCIELMAVLRKESTKPGKPKNHYQDLRAICLYLSFKYPEKYFLYKSRMYKDYKKKVGYSETSQELNSDIRKYDNYARMCHEVIQEIKADSELVQIQRNLIEQEPDCYNDPAFHLLAQTVIFVSKDMVGSHIQPENESKGAAVADEDVETTRFWLYSPGEGAKNWEECCKKGIMTLGWDEIGDYLQYSSKTAMKEAMKEQYHSDKAFTMAAHATWQFANEIKPGDIVFAKKGRGTVIGRGIVKSDYRYDDSREDKKSIRDITWTHVGEWEHPGQAAMKTLTDITPYTDYVEKLKALFVDAEEEYLPNDTLQQMAEQLRSSFFLGEMIPPYQAEDVIQVLKYYAQYEAAPKFYTFDAVDKNRLDVAAIAKFIWDQDMGPRKKKEYVDILWEDNDDNILRLFFGRKFYFWKQLDIEMMKLSNPDIFDDENNVKYGTKSFADLSLYEIGKRNPDYEKLLRDGAFEAAKTKDGKYRCAICGLQANSRIPFQVDHIIPMNKGGKTVPENLQILCRGCNARKSDTL